MRGYRDLSERGFVRRLLLVLTVIQELKTRSVAKMVLEDAGHRVVEAAGSTQAYSLLSNGLDPDLLICEGSSLDSSAGDLGHLLNFVPAHRICVIAGIGEHGLREQAA